MPTVDVHNIKMNYEWSGREDAPILILSCSLGTTLALWKPQAVALSQHFRIFRYDMRGHGGSTVAPGPYCVEMLGQDVLGLLDVLDITKASFCGISIGGVIGQWLAVHAPERFQRIILSNTAAKIGTSESWNQRIDQVHSHGMQSIADAVIARWFTEEFARSQPQTVAFMREMLISCNPDGYIAACAAIRDVDLRAQTRSICTPVCILGGTRDPVTTMEDGEWLHQQIPGSHFAALPASHISNIEAAAEFNSAVMKFMGALS